jgi:PAS domain S-box-containing protein
VTEDPRIHAFDALPSAILLWEYDPPLVSAGDLRLVAVNQATEAFGPRWPLGEWIGRLRRDMQPDIDELDELYLAVARDGGIRQVRGLRGRDGTILDAQIFALPSNRLAVSIDNVTEVWNVEQAYRAIIERTHDTILIIDPESEVVLETNPAAQTVYGRDIVGLSMFELSKNHRAGMSARIIQAGFVHFETTHLRADGREIHLDVHARPIVRQGRTVVAGISRDVTREVEARRALQESEEKYRNIVENVPVILWTTDRAGTALFLSGGVERVTGFSFEEVTQSLWMSRIEPTDRARRSAAYGALFESGTPFEVEYRFLRKDNRWAWFLDQAGRSYEKDGRRVADGVTQDITERKRGELQQLALAELGRRALAQTDPQALMDDACHTVASVLEVPMASVLLYEVTENAFVVAATWGVEIAPGFRVPNLPDRLAAQTFAGGEAITYDNIPEERRFHTGDLARLKTRAGVCVPISGREGRFGVLHAHTHEPRVFTAREAAFLQSTANVLAEALHRSGAERELERRQLQLANAQQLAHIGSLEVEVGTGRIECSDEMYRIAGLAPQSRPIDIEYVKTLLPADLHDLFSPANEQLAQGGIVEIDHELYAADGRTRIVHSRVRLGADRVTGRRKVAATVQDITEKRDADAALVRMQEKLLRTERMSQMGALVAGVAHEVRNPLFGISATLDAFENHYDLEEFRDYSAALREQVDRLSQLMHELLEYGRPFATVLDPQCIAVVVNGSVANAGTLARQHGVTLQSAVPPSLVAVPMDRPRMAQVFDNLIANAIQHSQAGGLVSISAEVTADGRCVRIAVEDRGHGFRADDLPRIFEPFFTRRRGGTGLGLSVVHRIVDEHGGTIVASNREGGGASMVVSLPIAPTAAEAG